MKILFDDIELLDRIKNDDKKAFEEIVNKYSSILFRFINKRINDIDDSQDILQDVFISLWHKRSKISIKESFYPYLFQSCKFEVIDWISKHEKEVEKVSLLTSKIENTTLFIDPISFEDKLMAEELELLIDQEIDKMPTTMKTVFTMSNVESLSIKEISKKLVISEQTVKNNLSLARKVLKLKFR